MKIIALKGKNGSGKSTVATMLSKKLDEKGISNKVLSFAEPLKKLLNFWFGESEDPVDFENRANKNFLRPELERVATCVKSSFSFNPFAHQVCMDLDLCYSEEIQVVIISDLRFESEYDSLYSWLETNDLTIVEISNVLTNNNSPEYDLDLIISNKTLNFDSSIEAQIDALITELL